MFTNSSRTDFLRRTGDISEEDHRENEYSLQHGFRVLSSYRTNTNETIWVVTESDRSVTTLLLPSEYVSDAKRSIATGDCIEESRMLRHMFDLSYGERNCRARQAKRRNDNAGPGLVASFTRTEHWFTLPNAAQPQCWHRSDAPGPGASIMKASASISGRIYPS